VFASVRVVVMVGVGVGVEGSGGGCGDVTGCMCGGGGRVCDGSLRQYLYFCTSKANKLCTFVLVKQVNCVPLSEEFAVESGGEPERDERSVEVECVRGDLGERGGAQLQLAYLWYRFS
jgi:hypothetical protein